MGNVALCLAGGPMVKVMLPDATIEKYDHPVQVAEVAAMHPNYAVVHCSAAKPVLGQLRAVIIMKMDEFLLPGQAYILYPIPKSLSNSVRYADGSEAASNKPDVGGEMTPKMGSRRGSRRQQEEEEEEARGQVLPGELTAEELELNLSQTLMGRATRKVSQEAVCAPVSEKKEPAVRKVPLEAPLPRLEMEGQKEKKENPGSQQSSWTPDLYQISED